MVRHISFVRRILGNVDPAAKFFSFFEISP